MSSNITENDYIYHDDNIKCIGKIVSKDDKPKPVVFIAHDWSGINDFAIERASWLANLGYTAIALDIYGEAKVGETIEEKQALMMPFLNSRDSLIKRLNAAIMHSETHPLTANQSKAAIGFCFGGHAVLEMARHQLPISGVISYHGLLTAQPPLNKKISAKVLALHGWADPMVQPESMMNFGNEMEQAEADWQCVCYGQTQHAFTNPNANDSNLGTIYNSKVAKRAYDLSALFLKEIFE
jgi:dienelactone hydrolase